MRVQVSPPAPLDSQESLEKIEGKLPCLCLRNDGLAGTLVCVVESGQSIVALSSSRRKQAVVPELDA